MSTPRQQLLKQLTYDWQNGAMSDPKEYALHFPTIVTAFRKFQVAKRLVDAAIEAEGKNIK